MKHRITTLAAVAFVAACGVDSPTQPAADFDVQPSFAILSVGLSNASFEEGYTGWTFPGSPGQFIDIGAFWATTDGTNSVDLNGFFAGYISQDIATVPGTAYTVLFDLAGNPGSPQNLKKLEVSAAGASANYEFDTTGKTGGTVASMGWRAESFTFTATGTTTTLAFTSLHTPPTHPDRAQGPAVDNVRVVFDAPNNPTTIDDCKKGGWAQYGFRNQGLCIQYVNTGKDSR
ncbi:MAG TPA: DUF642 domain-containing protein [Longimicrobiales bacterium]|nr:DUF642 domain-containing protein [Longimicrobiales bacterium]